MSDLSDSWWFKSWAHTICLCLLSSADAQKRKSKWDSAIPVTLAQPTLITTTATLPAVVSVTTTASGTKTTVISAVGTILKKAKQWTQNEQEPAVCVDKSEWLRLWLTWSRKCCHVLIIHVKGQLNWFYNQSTNALWYTWTNLNA